MCCGSEYLESLVHCQLGLSLREQKNHPHKSREHADHMDVFNDFSCISRGVIEVQFEQYLPSLLGYLRSCFQPHSNLLLSSKDAPRGYHLTLYINKEIRLI